MNIAISIGVSDYIKEQKLPACKQDAQRIGDLLSATGKYSDILLLNENTSATQLKGSIRDFFNRFAGKDIEEVFFYFSGHGSYHSALDDVLLCAADFDSKRPGFTSLTNQEIDALLRSLSPKLAVKVIDACNSGAQYIKDTDTGDKFEKALRESKLGAFHFMASSRLDQSSYANKEGSHFTTKFVSGALAADFGTVLYRDIQAYVADAFVDKKEQTPYFVAQGTGLESFATINKQMLELRKRLSGESEDAEKAQDSPGTDQTLKNDLLRVVTAKDAQYIDESEIATHMETAKKLLLAARITDPIIKLFYKLDLTLDSKVEALPNLKTVAEWLAEGKRERSYFVKLEYKTIERPATLGFSRFVRATILTGYSSHEDEKPKMVKVEIPVSVKTTRSLPYEVIQIRLQPNGHRALKPMAALVALLHSRTELIVLSAMASFRETGWDEYGFDETTIKWQQDIHTWKDVGTSPKKIWEAALFKLESAARKSLEEMLPKKEELQPVASPSVSEPPAKP